MGARGEETVSDTSPKGVLYEVAFRVTVEPTITVKANSLAEAVAIAKKLRAPVMVPADALQPEAVYAIGGDTGGLVVGACEACGVALIEGHSEYGYDEDGIYTCRGECIDGVNK